MRTILDGDLRRWEVYATAGAFGAPSPATLAFRCASDASVRPRALTVEGTKADVERMVRESSVAELLAHLERAGELD